jgi:hypothetical protein
MPSIHTSLLIAIPAGVGQMLPGLCNASVFQYIPIRPPENPVSASPATAFETKGESNAAPVAISAAASSRRNVVAGTVFTIGNAPAAIP